MREHERLDACRLRDASTVFDRCVAGEQMLLQRRRVRDSGDQAIHGRHVQRFMNQHIGALREPDESVGARRVSRNDNRPVRGIKAKGKRRHDLRMNDERRGRLEVLVLHDDATLRQLVDVYERSERDTALVGDTSLDIVGVHFKKQTRHLFDRRRPPRVDARPQAGGPREPDQIAVVGIVIRVLVRDKDVPQGRQLDAREDKLPGDAVPAIDDVWRVVREDHLGRSGRHFPRSRSSAGAEKDQPRPGPLPGDRPRPDGRSTGPYRCDQKRAPI